VLFNGTSHLADTPAPRVGENTADVLRQFGFAADEIESLLASGAAHQPGPRIDEPAAATPA
jgi:crotonobetainyl-CoA:carnitine CoA-transferase CaiB-like acyl-CoA transferase